MSDESTKPVNNTEDLEVLNTIVSAFRRLDMGGQKRVFDAVATLLGLNASHGSVRVEALRSGASQQSHFSEDRTMSVKDFLLEKQPKTDVHRVTCLAYYLTHYLATPHFKTLDISKLNTEAAQPKFSNAAKAVDNATLLGYLVPAAKGGSKQLGAMGERFVQALPDREAARAVVAATRTKRRAKRSASRDTGKAEDGPR